MTITLELPDALERQLREEAARKGVSLDRYIIQNLEDKEVQSVPSNLSETELLKKINLDLGIAPEVWSRYNDLKSRLKTEQLDEEGHQELIRLVEIFEAANVERLQFLVALSKIRRVSLEDVMSDLGIVPLGSDE